MVWDISPALLWHGSLGIWDEIISWGVFLTVAVVVGAFFYQQWREGGDDDLEDEALSPETLPDDKKDDHS